MPGYEEKKIFFFCECVLIRIMVKVFKRNLKRSRQVAIEKKKFKAISVIRDLSPWEAGEAPRVKLKWQPQVLQMLSPTLQGDESENLLTFPSGDVSPALL